MSLYSIPFYNSLLKKKLFTEKEKDKLSTNSHVLVYGAISIHNLGEKGCIASNETIGKEIGMSSQTVANCLTDLNKAGWIKVVMGSGNRRLKIIPKLTIGVLNVLKASSTEETPYSMKETTYSTEESTLLEEVTPLTCTSNIDNILDNSLNNSKENSRESNDWQAIVLYFYSKISPETSPNRRFIRGVKESAKHLLTLHSEKEIRETIDWLAGSADKKFNTSFLVFTNKYSTFNPTPKVHPSSKQEKKYVGSEEW